MSLLSGCKTGSLKSVGENQASIPHSPKRERGSGRPPRSPLVDAPGWWILSIRKLIMSRALLVIDVQREYFDGALPISHPSGHLDQILRVMDAAAKAKVPTAVIRHHQADPQSPIFRYGSDMWQLHEEVQRRPHEVLIDKQLPGAFTGTQLDPWLKQVGADTVTIAGYMTHICCDTTARQAMHRGYQVEFLRDATGTLDIANEAGEVTAEQLHQAILVAQQMFISEVVDTDAWLQRIA